MHKKLFILPIDEDQAEVLINFIKKQTLSSEEEISKSPISEEKRYLTIDELAEFLSMPRNTIYAKTSKREIPFTKVGKRLLFDKDEIKAWLASAQKKVLK